MITPNQNLLCEQAKIYYYDFLFLQDKSIIPESVLTHFRKCQNCQRQIYELKTMLTQAESKKTHGYERSGSAISNMLKLHFSYVEQKITCKIARPFLPGLLDASLQISVPTPITTHLDNCPDCVHDLDTINDLNLSDIQLFRLSRLFTASPDDNNIDCSRATSDIMAFGMMAFHETDKDVLEHLCLCRSCRSEIYRYREEVRQEYLLGKTSQPCFLSSHLPNVDIFDFVVPYGLNIEQYIKSETQKSRISHIRRCPFCLEKIQELHNTVYDIAERPNSDIVTTYNIDETAQSQAVDNPDNIYAGFPISVESTSSREYADSSVGSIINFTAALKKKILTSNVKSYSKAGIVAAAMIVVFTAILFYSPQAKAYTIEQLYSAFKQIDNVHITSFEAGDPEPSQEQWISRSCNILIDKSNNKFVLWDINNKELVNELGTQRMDDELLKDTSEFIEGSMGLTPFYSLKDLPPDAEWTNVTSEYQNINDGTEVYELKYTNQFYPNSHPINRLLFFLKPGKELPFRIEFYRKLPGENDYSLTTIKIIENISDNEILALKDSIF